MSKLVRFLSRRRTGKGIKRGVQQTDPKKKKHIITCTVVLLDDSDVTIELPKGALGDALQEQVFYHLDLLEKSYFGLQYTDAFNVNHWLDPTKKIKKQVAIGPPFTLRLRVKFFPTEPSVLKEELTRYQFFLHCKKDVLSGNLPLNDDAQAVELAALALQSELGDFDEEEHSPAFISEFRFVPNQSEDMEIEIYNKFRSLSGQKMTPDKAELQYLHKVKWLEMYGVDVHDVMGRDGLKYKLGLTPTGVLVFAGEERIGLFYWPRIVKFNFKKKRLVLVVVEDAEGGAEPQEHTFVFTSENKKACKHVWKCAIEHHAFFRVIVQPVSERQGKQGFIRLGSRFRYSGRTQFETLNRNNARRSVRFERQPSRRFSRRPSLDAKELKRRRQRPANLGAKIEAGSVPAGASHSPMSTATPMSNGAVDVNSPLDRLDNLILSDTRNNTINNRSSRETSPPHTGTLPKQHNQSILDQAEAAQARLKGLEGPTPEPQPRANKDVNLYQNNQVKVLSKEKVPIEMKSNNLKARSEEDRMTGSAVMQEDDNVSTESEDESPVSPMSTGGHSHHFNNGTRPRTTNGSTSSSRILPSPVPHSGSFHRDESDLDISVSSEKKQASLKLKPAPRVRSTTPDTTDDCAPLLGSQGSTMGTSDATVNVSTPSTGEVFEPANTSASSLNNLWFNNPEIREFLFSNQDTLLGDVANTSGSRKPSPNKLTTGPLETNLDSPLINLASPESDIEGMADASFDGHRTSSSSRFESLTNGDAKQKSGPPKPAPRKFEKRVCITTEL